MVKLKLNAITLVGKTGVIEELRQMKIEKGDFNHVSYICRGLWDSTCIFKHVVLLVSNEQDERMILFNSGAFYSMGGEVSC